MKMRIQTRRKMIIQGDLQKFASPVTNYPRGGGYDSVKAMQKELLRRFPNRDGVRNRKIPKGIVRREHGQTFVITLEQEY